MTEIGREESEKAGAKDATPEVPVAEVVKQLVIAADGAPILFTFGVKDAECTQTFILPPAFLRFVASLAELGSSGFAGMDDDDDIWDDDDDDVDFDDDEVDEWDENTYPNPDPAELEDEDFDDDEF